MIKKNITTNSTIQEITESFRETCKLFGIRYKNRYFRGEVAVLTGHSPKTWDDWVEGRYKPPFQINRDRTGKHFVFMLHLAEFLSTVDDIKRK